MKKTTAAIALLLAISAVLYLSNTSLAEKAACPSTPLPGGQTSNDKLSFRVDSFGGTSSVGVFIRPDGGSYGSAPSFSLTQEGVYVTKHASEIPEITGTGTYYWNTNNGQCFGPSEAQIIFQ